ncbi:MAG: NADH-quinone oxidoreductase subunit J [Bdellovibrionales bacterium]
MDATSLTFYFLEALILLSALGVVLVSNPIYSALFLVLSMIGVAGIFVSLEAYFVAVIQLVVYAGAVTVLFVMVIMLFNLEKEKKAFSQGFFSLLLRVGIIGAIWAVVASALKSTFVNLTPEDMPFLDNGGSGVKVLAETLFTQYVFGFEIISVLLVTVIVGAVALARAKGGTHA